MISIVSIILLTQFIISGAYCETRLNSASPLCLKYDTNKGSNSCESCAYSFRIFNKYKEGFNCQTIEDISSTVPNCQVYKLGESGESNPFQCATCNIGFYQEEGICIKNSISNCLIERPLSPENIHYCDLCQRKFYFDSKSGKCLSVKDYNLEIKGCLYYATLPEGVNQNDLKGTNGHLYCAIYQQGYLSSKVEYCESCSVEGSSCRQCNYLAGYFAIGVDQSKANISFKPQLCQYFKEYDLRNIFSEPDESLQDQNCKCWFYSESSNLVCWIIMIAVGLVLLLLVLLIVVLWLLKDLGKSMQTETEEPMMNREEEFVEDFN